MVALKSLSVAGYRSIRDLTIPLGPVNIITGANGTGKSNLYQSLVLVSQAASGRFARAIAEEGGMPSILWAGGERHRSTRKKPPKRCRLSIETDDFAFGFSAGLPKPGALATMFTHDPEVKDERISLSIAGRRVVVMERTGPSAWLRNNDGAMETYPLGIAPDESVLSQVVEPHRYPEVSMARQAILRWRFYHQFRTDPSSPMRTPQFGMRTNVLSKDGLDLAAALETIREVGHVELLDETIARAFHGASIEIGASGAMFDLSLRVPGLLRALSVRELSDGQLRFLCLTAALLSPRPPDLIALNEPETSLHPDLYQPLAGLIAEASATSQIWVTTHAQPLADAISSSARVDPIKLELIEGETRIAGDPNSPRRPHQWLHFTDDGDDTD